MVDTTELNQIILDSLPHWAMLIDSKTRTILAANKLALDGGAKINCQCWDDFGHRQFISEEHKDLISENPDRKRDNKIKCDFCLADEAIEKGQPTRKEVEIEGILWDTFWVPVEEDLYLHYAMDITSIRKTQDALQESEERYFKVVNTMRDGLAIASKDGLFKFVNLAFCNNYQYTQDELIGTHASRLILPEYHHVFEQFFKDLGKTGHFSGETIDVRKDGTTFNADIKGARILFQGQECFLAVIRDITERKQTEEVLRDNEKRLRDVLDGLGPEMFVGLLDPKGTVLLANRSAMEAAGLSPKDVFGKSVADTYWFTWSEAVRQRMRTAVACAAQGEQVHYDEQIRVADGQLIWLDFMITPQRDETGRISFLIPSALVITDRKQAEDALQESEKQYRYLFDLANEGLVMTTPDGQLFKVNQAFAKMHGYTVDEIKRLSIKDFDVLGERLSEDRADFMRRIQAGETVRFEVEHYHKDGHIFPISVTTSMIDIEGKQYYLSFNQDISERKETEDRIQRAQKLESIGTLAGGIAHDFNNLLSPLLGFTELLKEDIPADSPLQEYIDEILSATFRSKDLVKQILAVSRSDEPNVIPIRLQPIVKEAMDLLRASIPTTIDIQRDIASQCGIVMADATQIHQLVMNLATNAYHAMGDAGGRLEVTLRQVEIASEPDSLQTLTPGHYALLTVSDTGSGIEKEILERIFDPYFTTKGVGEGTGLGLSVVRGIVTSHKGIIDVSSVPKKGTKFSVYLPIIEHTTEHIIVEDTGLDPVGTEKILLVDDEVPIIRMEQQILERLGYRVTPHTNSNDALAVFKANPGGFDLVLTDMTMPNMTGIQLAKELASIRRDIPVILSTGYSEQISKETAEQFGIRGFLKKPVLKSNMAHMVRNVLDEVKGSVPKQQ